jgi:lysozyme
MSFRTKAKGMALIGGGVLALATPLVAHYEGLMTNAYLDPVGIPTICYGSTRGVKIGDSKTKEQCNELLNEELKEYLQYVDDYIYVPMPDTRRAALTSFVYNVGPTAFKSSTLRRLMNEGKTRKACEELSRWIFAKGHILRGLVRRREAEKEMCLKGLSEET